MKSYMMGPTCETDIEIPCIRGGIRSASESTAPRLNKLLLS